MPKVTPGASDYTLGDVLAHERAQTLVDQKVQISSDSPIRCSAPTCRRDIKTGDAYAVITTPHGTVIWHLWCIGIMRYGNFNDPAFAAAIRQRLSAILS